MERTRRGNARDQQRSAYEEDTLLRARGDAAREASRVLIADTTRIRAESTALLVSMQRRREQSQVEPSAVER
jgi:hypothetical protein